MRVRELLSPRQAIVSEVRMGDADLGRVSLDGLTFGFEMEMVLRQDWYASEIAERDGNYRMLDELDFDEFTEHFDYDSDYLEGAYETWKDDAGDADASVEDYFQAVGIKQVIDAANAKPKEEYVLVSTGQGIAESQHGQMDAYWAFKDAVESQGVYAEVWSEAKQSEKEPEEWYIEPDASIQYDQNSLDWDLELTSPAFDSVEEPLSYMKDIFAWIDKEKVADTNHSTGLHLNIGFARKPRHLDFVKVAVLLGEKHLADAFSRSLDNVHTESRLWDIFRNADKVDLRTFAANFDKVVKVLNKALDITDKGYVFNHIPYREGKNYIEFRIAGGQDYHKNYPLVRKTVLRMAYVLKLATDPQAFRQEYMKKLYKLLFPAATKSQTTIGRAFSKFLIGLGGGDRMKRFLDHDGEPNPGSLMQFLELLYTLSINDTDLQQNRSIIRAVLNRMGFNQASMDEFTKRYSWYADLDDKHRSGFDTVVAFLTPMLKGGGMAPAR